MGRTHRLCAIWYTSLSLHSTHDICTDELSVRLYHAMFDMSTSSSQHGKAGVDSAGPAPIRCASELANTRETVSLRGPSSRKANRTEAMAVLLQGGWMRREPDCTLHAAAAVVFWQRVCHTYQLLPLPDPRCPSDPLDLSTGNSTLEQLRAALASLEVAPAPEATRREGAVNMPPTDGNVIADYDTDRRRKL